MRDASEASFDFFSDPEGRLIDLLDVRHVGGRTWDGVDLPQSSRFLIDPSGKILWSHLAANYRVRPRPRDVLAAIDARLPSS